MLKTKAMLKNGAPVEVRCPGLVHMGPYWRV